MPPRPKTARAPGPGLRRLLLLAAVFLVFSLSPAQAHTGTGPAGAEQEEGADHLLPDPSDGPPPDTEAVICYHNSAAFVVRPPTGWTNDKGTATLLGVCAIYTPVGSNYNDAKAVLYPNVGTARGRTIEESADIQAEWIRKTLSSRKNGEKIQVRYGKGLRNEKGHGVAIRYYDQGPPPNEWEAAAYLQHNGQLLMLVLSAREKQDRDAAVAQLEEAASQVVGMDYSRPPEKKAVSK